jgi:flagellar hook-associated protein 3 FlgL
MRVTTSQSMHSALLSMQLGQARVDKYLKQVNTGKIGDSLADFATRAETLMATRGVQVRTDTHIANAQALNAKLKTQDAALGRVVEGANAAVAAVTKALANNDGGAFLAELQSAMDQAVDGLNTSYTGGYLFAGGRGDTPPVSITKLMDLDDPPPLPPALPPPRPNPFTNGTFVAENRLDDDSVAKTGVLADDLAGKLFEGLADVAAFPESNFGAPLTQTQHDFLTTLLAKFTEGAAHAVEIQAGNGALQKNVEDNLNVLRDRKDMAASLIADVTEADPLEAASRLTAAQTALQASAKAFTTLQESSLLNLLYR